MEPTDLAGNSAAGHSRSQPEGVATPAATAGRPRAVGLPGLGAASVVLLALLLAALFLPWASGAGGAQSLAEYAAPQPAVIAWVLLALGVSTCALGTLALLMRERQGLYGLGLGACLYLAGALTWYGATIWPSIIASGCQTNGGPLCAQSPASPTTVSSGAGSGFVMGTLAALAVLVLVLAGARIVRPAGRLVSDR